EGRWVGGEAGWGGGPREYGPAVAVEDGQAEPVVAGERDVWPLQVAPRLALDGVEVIGHTGRPVAIDVTDLLINGGDTAEKVDQLLDHRGIDSAPLLHQPVALGLDPPEVLTPGREILRRPNLAMAPLQARQQSAQTIRGELSVLHRSTCSLWIG